MANSSPIHTLGRRIAMHFPFAANGVAKGDCDDISPPTQSIGQVEKCEDGGSGR
jgi:hypothetical protein